jgi:ribosomal protein S18 acetylase RimI-like enzyme
MRITRASARHVDALVRLMTRSPLLRRYGMTSRIARAGLAEGMRERDLLLVAQERGEVLGMAWVILTRALDRAAYLRLLLVAEDVQSRGAGAALLAEAERRARAAGCRHFVFLVTADNRRARWFYERHGYKRIGTLRGFVRSRIDEALYVKSWRASHR